MYVNVWVYELRIWDLLIIDVVYVSQEKAGHLCVSSSL